MRRSGGVVWLKTVVLMVTAAAMLTCVMCRSPVRHLVGGKEMWKPNYNYTDWSREETFYVGDWLCKQHVFVSVSNFTICFDLS